MKNIRELLQPNQWRAGRDDAASERRQSQTDARL